MVEPRLEVDEKEGDRGIVNVDLEMHRLVCLGESRRKHWLAWLFNLYGQLALVCFAPAATSHDQGTRHLHPRRDNQTRRSKSQMRSERRNRPKHTPIYV
jgi:hypothetical protein